MRFFKFRKNYKFNWKYVLGEVLLLFVGISLAIWFNNWNTSNKADSDKALAIVKIKGEIKNNRDELVLAHAKNELIEVAFSEYNKVFHNSTSEVLTTPAHMDSLQKAFPKFYTATDSVEITRGVYKYKGGTRIELELFELTEIAWETARSINITNEFEFECLYQLESTYNLQRSVWKEMDKASNALQSRDLPNLMSILDFMSQLNPELIESYDELLVNLDNCR